MPIDLNSINLTRLREMLQSVGFTFRARNPTRCTLITKYNTLNPNQLNSLRRDYDDDGNPVQTPPPSGFGTAYTPPSPRAPANRGQTRSNTPVSIDLLNDYMRQQREHRDLLPPIPRQRDETIPDVAAQAIYDLSDPSISLISWWSKGIPLHPHSQRVAKLTKPLKHVENCFIFG